MFFAEHEWEQVTVSELECGDTISVAELAFGAQAVEAGAVVIDSITWMKDSTVADIYAGPGGYRRVFEDIRAGDMVWRQVPGKTKVDLLTAPLSEVIAAVMGGADVRQALNALDAECTAADESAMNLTLQVERYRAKALNAGQRFAIINHADNAREIAAGRKGEES